MERMISVMQQEQDGKDAASRDIVARGLLIAQTKKELIARLKQYKVGFCLNGQILMSKDMETLDGILFVIPKFDYLELFGG